MKIALIIMLFTSSYLATRLYDAKQTAEGEPARIEAAKKEVETVMELSLDGEVKSYHYPASTVLHVIVDQDGKFSSVQYISPTTTTSVAPKYAYGQ